ncbi:ribose 5-phosphate isomerase B [Polymorphobacter fuscus]|uniref:Ribose 5-phosphate isomerase B n=1 Tax=Sandarakinorhabdus fusca TaxID=1439888 RepID=A0A7C9LEC9_9SPHN|nr:ribose 5-phosphate isomerase B [Polymorphobacter fuscus]KAB7648315.1 ribose 5-phosphate isomerase B [Polymorphobacter fuscus]MQT15827.1 ribose 5-phosphate isomerase B [Polymorphobacter fuscus]NJC07899.1 ribose 5-phosphate isomerase B [Polymorphobacter fuscus]
MTIVALASDHAGVAYKAMLIDEVRGLGHGVIDLGPNSDTSVDYPDYGTRLAEAIADGRATFGVAICGSGIGISIAANRNPAVRAALCTSGLMARLARQHNDANVLALGSRIIGPDTARDCLTQFLAAGFAGGRHAGRVAKLTPGHEETIA